MNLKQLRKAIRIKTGYPERGDAGTKRLNNILNQALRKLWGEIPEVLLRDEYRFILEPQVKLTKVNLVHTAYSFPENDNRCFAIVATNSPIEATDITDKVLRGRWLEVQGSDDRWHQRRIQDVHVKTIGNDPAITYHVIVADKPFSTQFAKADMDARIYTYEYPYPADVQSIRQVVRNPEKSGRQIPVSMLGPEMTRHKFSSGWQDSGEPDYYQRGDYFQLPSPHYKPEIEASSQGHTFGAKWGYDPDLLVDYTYGRAGTFSYKVCHVWGRWPKERGYLWRVADGVGENQGLPFYISAPSEASEKQSVVWGGSALRVKTPDVDYVFGYSQSQATMPWSYHHHGVEKWIFRARHENSDETPTGVLNKDVQADGEYYLWRIVEGHDVEVIDNGSYDPVDRDFPIKEFVGHQHIRFDKRPTSKDDVLLSCVRRPDLLGNDTDVSRIPPECYNALIELSCSYLLGDRDGSLDRKSVYFQAYQLELAKMKRDYSFSGHERPGFGDGLGSTHYYGSTTRPIKEA